MADGDVHSKLNSDANASQTVGSPKTNSSDILSMDFIPLREGDSTEESDDLSTNDKQVTMAVKLEDVGDTEKTRGIEQCQLSDLDVQIKSEEIPGPSGIQNDDDDNDKNGGGDDDDDNDKNGGVDDDDESQESKAKVKEEAAYPHMKKENEFTSEIFKIEIANLPKYFGFKQFKKLLESNLSFKPVKIKATSGARVAFITFRNEEERQKALTTFHGKKWKGKELTTKLAKALPDPVATMRATQRAEALGVARKRFIDEACDTNIDAKRIKLGSTDDETTKQSILDRLNFSVTPLWNIPYPKQIEIKFKFIVDTLQRFTDELNDMAKRSEGEAVSCELMACIPSPVVNGYRNKCEYTITDGPDGEKTVGFRVGSYKDGFSGVVEPSHCIHISDTAKTIASLFQKYIRRSSLLVFDLCFHTGHWQTLTVRTTQFGESMVVVQFNPQDLTQCEIDDVLKEIKEFFTEGEGKECMLTSLYVQVNPSRAVGGSVQAPLTLLSGTPCIHEIVHGVKFRISPNVFFQVNSKAAEKMFDIMREWMGDCSESMLLDICCGTGTIGLCLAKYVTKVIGVELLESAVEDAKKNAEINDIKNATFVAGKAEKILVEQVLKKLPWKMPVIGIADPPRAGLHNSVIKAIRRCVRMDRLIYVSCNANSAYANFIDLCRPTSKRIKTTPFRFVKAIPIDFFPHTQHCELIMLFERDKAIADTSRYYKFSFTK